MIAALLLLVSCGPHTPPAVFTTPIAEAPPPVVLEIPDELDADACPGITPYLPGSPPPYTTAGVVTCRAQLVPERELLEAYADRGLVDYWQGQYDTSHYYRGIDRMHCEDIAGARWEHSRELERELRVTKATAAGSAVAGFILGAVIVAGIERATR